jgi:transposase
VKKIHAKFPKCYLFMDKASSHYTCKVIKYFEENKDTLIPVYLPTTSPELWLWKKFGT